MIFDRLCVHVDLKHKWAKKICRLVGSMRHFFFDQKLKKIKQINKVIESRMEGAKGKWRCRGAFVFFSHSGSHTFK